MSKQAVIENLAAYAQAAAPLCAAAAAAVESAGRAERAFLSLVLSNESVSIACNN